jgi:hypothetical protein
VDPQSQKPSLLSSTTIGGDAAARPGTRPARLRGLRFR